MDVAVIRVVVVVVATSVWGGWGPEQTSQMGIVVLI